MSFPINYSQVLESEIERQDITLNDKERLISLSEELDELNDVGLSQKLILQFIRDVPKLNRVKWTLLNLISNQYIEENNALLLQIISVKHLTHYIRETCIKILLGKSEGTVNVKETLNLLLKDENEDQLLKARVIDLFRGYGWNLPFDLTHEYFRNVKIEIQRALLDYVSKFKQFDFGIFEKIVKNESVDPRIRTIGLRTSISLIEMRDSYNIEPIRNFVCDPQEDDFVRQFGLLELKSIGEYDEAIIFNILFNLRNSTLIRLFVAKHLIIKIENSDEDYLNDEFMKKYNEYEFRGSDWIIVRIKSFLVKELSPI